MTDDRTATALAELWRVLTVALDDRGPAIWDRVYPPPLRGWPPPRSIRIISPPSISGPGQPHIRPPQGPLWRDPRGRLRGTPLAVTPGPLAAVVRAASLSRVRIIAGPPGGAGTSGNWPRMVRVKYYIAAGYNT